MRVHCTQDEVSIEGIYRLLEIYNPAVSAVRQSQVADCLQYATRQRVTALLIPILTQTHAAAPGLVLDCKRLQLSLALLKLPGRTKQHPKTCTGCLITTAKMATVKRTVSKTAAAKMLVKHTHSQRTRQTRR